jgi:exopolysaccharide biosynthesis polyprenyl glycosylphosphotransferase
MNRTVDQIGEMTPLTYPMVAGHRIQLPRVPLRISERRVLLGLLDLMGLNGALFLVLWLRMDQPFSIRVALAHPLWFALLSVLWLLIARAFDAYDLKNASRFSTSVLCVLKSAFLVLLVYMLILYLTPNLLHSRLTLGLFFALSLAFLAAGRGLYAFAVAQPLFQRRALIVGAGWAGRTLLEALQENGDGGYQVMGFVDDDLGKHGQFIDDVPVLGGRQELSTLIKRYRASTLVLAITHDVDGELFQILMDSLEQGVEIVPMPVIYEAVTGRVPIEHIGDNWYVAMPIHHPGTGALHPLVKRAMDIVLVSIGFFFLGLAFPFIALAIYLDSPGPLFYTQERVGKGGKIFRAYKFRSMVPDAEKKGEAVWAEKGDPRVTRVGRLLRATHVDEFPQFVNILRGEMSPVGPRAERPELVAELEKEIPFYRTRHSVKPGMAGWGLVKQGYAASKEDSVVKLQYDLYYIKHQSVWLDLVILLKTIVDTVTFGGR